MAGSDSSFEIGFPLLPLDLQTIVYLVAITSLSSQPKKLCVCLSQRQINCESYFQLTNNHTKDTIIRSWLMILGCYIVLNFSEREILLGKKKNIQHATSIDIYYAEFF